MNRSLIFVLIGTLALSLGSCARPDVHPQTALEDQGPAISPQVSEQPAPALENRHKPIKPFSGTVKRDPWPQTPPQIGRLVLKQEYWNYMKEAARKYQVSPYLIQAVCAIESRYDPRATSGRGACIGLMQLHRGTAKKYRVDPWNPRENIMGGAAVLANLLNKCNGDLRRALRIYNAESTAAYEREVFKAYAQAMKNGQATYQVSQRRQ